MKFSTQEEYGLRCLLSIAQCEPGQSKTIPQIAKEEQLSHPHVAKLLMLLRKSGFIKSVRGHAGGYYLAMEPKAIILGDVFEALGGRLIEPNFCARHSGLSHRCIHEGDCAVQFVFAEVQEAVDRVLQNRTLADVLDVSNRSKLKMVERVQRMEKFQKRMAGT
ncbi:MAG: Rrf2 family transcriptional regulator [Fimbriimonadaceae bacterium]|uniref:Rrf2 family transcriptional regulator n=1 Tax=Candidatus Nitrosymbiomonas proteolyticus TaxID=2608984 RepID=A0A809S9E8_9BACT|nr:Rrf2 family transcriptional regulator [Fimbriimonadaceae bacterium]NUM38717.1 Rrf2 family transcriptional regulator [Armatimonadota bacterium]BBO23591.1 Rrf2 family transcriptional regulator [Candidatus Nitrosymbiomonas proteolyticus]